MEFWHEGAIEPVEFKGSIKQRGWWSDETLRVKSGQGTFEVKVKVLGSGE